MQVAWTMDQPGPMARSVEDVAVILGTVAGYDAGDPMSSRRPVPNYREELTGESALKGLRIGVPRFWFDVDRQVQAAFETALRDMQDAGAHLIEVTFPSFYLTPAVAWSIIATEFASLHEITRGDLNRYGHLMAMRMVIGEFVTAADYIRAQRIRHLMQLETEKVFQKVDVVVTPTTPTTAGRFIDGGTCVVDLNGQERLWIEESPKPTQPFSLTGLAAVSVPCGCNDQGMPVGLQIVAPPHRDGLALRVGHAYECGHDYATRVPTLLR